MTSHFTGTGCVLYVIVLPVPNRSNEIKSPFLPRMCKWQPKFNEYALCVTDNPSEYGRRTGNFDDDQYLNGTC